MSVKGMKRKASVVGGMIFFECHCLTVKGGERKSAAPSAHLGLMHLTLEAITVMEGVVALRGYVLSSVGDAKGEDIEVKHVFDL